MKKGFTLVELLIVMVIVGVLVTIALPKYYVAMERGRVMEAVNNLRAASEAVNAAYIMNGNSYPASASLTESGHVRGDLTQSVYFSLPTIKASDSSVVQISSNRQNGDVYQLLAYNEDGELRYISCSGTDASKICENIGFEKNGESYLMDFRQ